jgi:hypothetical protein
VLRFYNNHNAKNARTFLNKLENYYLNKNWDINIYLLILLDV